MESVGILAGSGWASGINLCLVTLLLGIAVRVGWNDVPEVFGRTDVMIVAGILFTLEFVADEIPFFDELTRRFGAQGGDVAEANVIAHEVGHHVQNVIGTMDEVKRAQQESGSQAESNALSVALELQADCYAGVWANSIRDAGVFLPGEIEEAIDAAAAVGDDRIQERVQGQVTPERWTHGSSAQRVEWFNRGCEAGDPSLGSTFS